MEQFAHHRQQVQAKFIFMQELFPHIDAVLNFSRMLTSDKMRAEDLVQETYLKAWRFIDRYEAGTNPKAWLFKICKHAFINEYRAGKSRPSRRNTLSFEDYMTTSAEDAVIDLTYLGLHEDLQGKLLGDEVTRAINNLNEKYRTVVLLDLEEFSYEEIAAILDIPIGTVRSRLHRSRAALAETLREYAGQKGYNVSDETQPNTEVEDV